MAGLDDASPVCVEYDDTININSGLSLALCAGKQSSGSVGDDKKTLL